MTQCAPLYDFFFNGLTCKQLIQWGKTTWIERETNNSVGLWISRAIHHYLTPKTQPICTTDYNYRSYSPYSFIHLWISHAIHHKPKNPTTNVNSKNFYSAHSFIRLWISAAICCSSLYGEWGKNVPWTKPHKAWDLITLWSHAGNNGNYINRYKHCNSIN